MVNVFTILLALIIGLSFGGMTFAKSLGDSSSIQSTFPMGSDEDKDDKGKEGDSKLNEKDGDDKGGKEGEKE